ncbi:putative ribonuclease III [Microsporum canis]|uniref:RNase III domain-containing protein n=1 Tax=Arthroderma otae (strain ATCC MYA-4605 / CBS 113480) TaxID=554155 RepID=C5FXF7_ARTOC|nr:conserved hypothetical protein [Microsporum canis CBS 113480]EEQ34997.1 conserved hypothetical protein [Microsporum canis CBS 113480]
MSNLGGTNYSSRREDSEAVEGILDYSFKDKCLVLQALSLPGSSAYSTGNKGLAQVGDAAVRLHIISEGHQRGMSRGQISAILGRVSNNNNLAEVGVKKNLGESIFINRSQVGSISPGSMATTVEALLGAVYIDSEKDMDKLKNSMNALGLSFSEQA